jgi:hypothetical protein
MFTMSGGKMSAVLGHADRQRAAGLDVVAHLTEHRARRLVLGLLGQDVQGTEQGQSAVDHRGELAREDGEVLELDLGALAEGDLLSIPLTSTR